MNYNWQQPDWPDFRYQLNDIEDILFAFADHAGRAGGILEGLSDVTRTETVVEIMVAEALKTSEIEGEYLNIQDVKSSIKNNLGLEVSPQRHDQRAEGIAQLMVDVRISFAEDLTKEKLFSWHSMIMKGNQRIKIGYWRTHKEKIQVISGPVGNVKVHFEAPPSDRVPREMQGFIEWFNGTGAGKKNEIKNPIVRSAIAHLFFESIHPFEDGNGRMGRALSEKVLSQGVGYPILLSLSKTIEANKKDYYDALKKGSSSNEITSWIVYFAYMVLEAQIQTEHEIHFILKKSKFLNEYQNDLNARQLKVIHRILFEGPKGFVGGMSTKKYISITKTSKATAIRDLQDLVKKGIFFPFGSGRNTSYQFKMP